jgi:hypothetical protein
MSKQEVIPYILGSINLLILFGKGKNCHNSGRNPLQHLFVKGMVKQINNRGGISLLPNT